MNLTQRIPLAALALTTLLLSVSCGTTSHSASRITEMRVANLSPDVGNLDLLIDNKVVFSNLAYGSPTAFKTITAVNHDLKLNLSGAPTNILDNPAETFAGNTSYTYLVVGNATGGNVRANKLTDDHTAPTDKGNFKIRVVNGSPGAGAVDVYILKPTDKLSDPTVKPTIASLASETASTYQSLASGSYYIFITASNNKNIVLVHLDGLDNMGLPINNVPSFQAGQNRTLIMENSVPIVAGGGLYTTLPMLADLN